jgi:hypothetical protein
MLRRLFAIALTLTLALLLSWSWAPASWAMVQAKLFDLSYHTCPPELGEGAVISGGPMAANCFIVTGKVENTTNKTIYNADVYGRVYDANNNPVMQNRTRLDSIEEIPPGISDFSIRISVAANQPTPLKLEQFKAAGFTGKVRR